MRVTSSACWSCAAVRLRRCWTIRSTIGRSSTRARVGSSGREGTDIRPYDHADRARGSKASAGLYLWTARRSGCGNLRFFSSSPTGIRIAAAGTRRDSTPGYFTTSGPVGQRLLPLASRKTGTTMRPLLFTPLYPALIAGLGRGFFGHYILAGLVISLLAVSLVSLCCTPGRRAPGCRPERGGACSISPCFPDGALPPGRPIAKSLFLAPRSRRLHVRERDRFAAAGLVAGLRDPYSGDRLALLPALALLGVAPPGASTSSRRHRAGGAGWRRSIPSCFWQQVAIRGTFTDAQDRWHATVSRAGPFGGIWDGLVAGWRGLEHSCRSRHARRGCGSMHAAAENVQAVAFLFLFLRAHGRGCGGSVRPTVCSHDQPRDPR